MSIAQRTVAGEGEAHPQQDGPDNNRNDSEALAAFRFEAVNLPWIIFRASFRASRIDGLSARARAVLAALARTVDARSPYGAIFAGRELLTDRAMQSMRTFYRSLDDLESSGFVTRTAQARYAAVGKFGRTYIHLTERAATLLGLVKPVEAPSPAAESESPDAHASSLETPSANVAHGGIYRDLLPTAFQKRQPGRVPADLQRLQPLGFRDFLIFRLMREAREAGKRLSDVVEATWDNLKKAARPISYLRALLRNPVDFGHQVRTRDADRRSQADAQAERESANVLVHNHAGESFIDDTGTRKFVLDATATVLTVSTVDEGVPRQDAGDWKLRLARALRAGRIRVASDADLEAFAQARRNHAPAALAVPDVPRVASAMAMDSIAAMRAALRASAMVRA